MLIPKNAKTNFNILDSGLFGDIVSKDSKSIGFMSGFTYFDFPTAYYDVSGIDGNILPNGGLFPRVYTVIGESETGKTTAIIQLAGSIVDSCWGANLVFIDAEGNTTPERIKSLNCWNDREYMQKCMYVPPSPPISINDVYNLIRKIAHAKDIRGDKIKVQTPYKDIYTGKFIEVFPPTVLVLDSVPALVISQTLDDAIDGKKDFKNTEQISQNIDGMREAKDNTNFLRKIKGLLDQYNIIFLQINHTNKEVAMSMFDKPKKYHPHMKAGEKLKGGSEQIFQSFGIFRISQKEMIDERNPIYGDYIRGYVCSLDHVKNKANVSASEFRYVFDKRTGFRPELTDFEYLNEKKIGLSGSPASMYLTILPEIKFTRKNLVGKCAEFPALTRALSFMAKYVMGNEYILQNRYGVVDLDAFARMPFDWRMSIILSMTTPYPRYGLQKFDNDELLESQDIAALGDIYTGLGNGYVSPVNINTINKIVNNSENGYCHATGCVYDPLEFN